MRRLRTLIVLVIVLLLTIVVFSSCSLLFSTEVKVINNTSYTLEFGYRSGYSTGYYALLGTIYSGTSKTFDLESGVYDFVIENAGSTIHYQYFSNNYDLVSGTTCVVTAYNGSCYID